MAKLLGLLIPFAIGITQCAQGFEVTAKSALIMDEATGKILWQKGAHERRYPASTTKIMTALLLLENTFPAEKIVAPAGVERIQPSSLNLRKGEIVSARGMLYALMLRSANDGCVAVAHHISGSVSAFSKLMNKRAKEIGCLNTTFNNPNGLNDKKHLTTAYDLALMAREAMKLAEFREAVRTQKFQITRSINQKDLMLKSHNKWLAKDSTADGIKTGYTRDAGKCYVGSVTRDGYRLITVILNSKDWQEDHMNMMDWAYANHYRETVATRDGEVMSVPLENSEPAELPIVVRDSVVRIRRAEVKDTVSITASYATELIAPIAEGQELGTITFADAYGWKKTVPMYAGASVEPDPPIMATAMGRTGFGILIGACVFGIFGMKSRKRRARPHAKTARPQRLAADA